MSKLLTKQKRITRKCRGEQNHYSIHSPKHDVEFCRKCDAYVEVIDIVEANEIKKDRCRCCTSKTEKMQKKTWVSRVLKAGIRQHHNYIHDWSSFPEGCEIKEVKPRSYVDLTGKRIFVKEIFTKKPKSSQYVEIKYKGTIYAMQVRYLALYLEALDYNGEDHLKNLEKKIFIKGYNMWYDKDTEMDEKCVTCHGNLKYNLNNQIFCPNCNGNF